MKLTARLLKKIIRESVQKGVPGIGKFYADEEGKLDPESARQAVDFSAMLGQDIEPEDLDETILIEIKEIMADFVEQYYQNFIQQANEAEGGDNYPDEYDPIPGVRQRIDAIIDKNYYTQPRVLNTSLAGVVSLTTMQSFIDAEMGLSKSRGGKRLRRQKVKAFKAELKKLNRFFKSYDELLAALSPETQEFLESLNVKNDINRKIQKNAQIVKANHAIKMRPIPEYQNEIRLAKNKKEIAIAFNIFKRDIIELKKFMSENLYSHFGYGSMFITPLTFVIDPEKVKTVHHEPDFSWTENAPRKTIEHLDQNQHQKSSIDLMAEIEKYVEEAISGEFVGRYADPMVKQKFLPKKFPMTEAILKKLILEELSSLISEQEERNVTLEDLGLNKASKIHESFLFYDDDEINFESGRQYLQIAASITPIIIDIEGLINEANKVILSDIKRYIIKQIEFAYEDFYYHHEMSVSAKKKKKAMEKLMIAYAKPISLIDNWDGSLEGFMEFYYSFENTATRFSALPWNNQLHSSGLENSDLRNYSKIFKDIFRTKDILEYAKRKFGGLRKSDKFEEAFLEAQKAIEITIIAEGYWHIREYFTSTPEGEPPEMNKLFGIHYWNP